MASTMPWVVRLPLPVLRRARSVAALLARAEPGLVQSFEFKNDERPFVEELLHRKSNLWVFRTNQRKFCGDFVVVDMSGRRGARRAVFVIDLKQAAPLKLGGGGAGIQFRNAARAVAEVAGTTGAIPPDAPFVLLSGDRQVVLRFLRGLAT